MKKILIALTLVLSVPALAGEITVNVKGMVCSMCAQGIEKKFKTQAEVEGIHVNLDEKVVHIKTHEGKDLEDSLIEKLITEAGYNVASISRK